MNILEKKKNREKLMLYLFYRKEMDLHLEKKHFYRERINKQYAKNSEIQVLIDHHSD